ncbi:MAG: glycosyltransferase family 4 protein [Planctomycetota bacterium]
MSYRILYHHRIRADDGQAVHVREMIAALRQLGHEVEECALVPKAEGRRPVAGRRGGLWQRLRLPRVALETMEMAYSRSATQRLVAVGRRLRPHFVYERHALHCDAGLRAARGLGVPLLLEVNSPMCDEMAKLGSLRFPRRARATETRVLGGADRVLAVSGVLRQRLLQCGAAAERTLVVCNGAAVERFGANAREGGVRLRRVLGLAPHAFVVGFVGYARPWHRLDVVLDALRHDSLQHAHLWVVGEGPALPTLRAQAERDGLAQRLHLVGAVSAAEVPSHVCAFDAAVIAAINEYASPLKLFDYLAAGVPVIAPDQANLRELVDDGETAVLVPPGDTQALAVALGRVGGDPAFATRLGAAGRRKLQACDWTWQGAARRVVEAYEAARP